MLSLNSYPNFMGPGQHPNIFAADAEKRVLRRVSGSALTYLTIHISEATSNSSDTAFPFRKMVPVYFQRWVRFHRIVWSLYPFRSLSPCYKASFACSPARESEDSRLDANLEGARACTRPRSRSLRRSFIASFLSSPSLSRACVRALSRAGAGVNKLQSV